MSASAQLVRVAMDPASLSLTPDSEEHVIAVRLEADDRILLSVVEAARRLGVGRSMMYELLGSGQIESIHIGRLHRVPVAALSTFVEQRRGR